MENLTEKIDALFDENKGVEAEALMLQALHEAKERQNLPGEAGLQACADTIPILNELIGYCRETGQAEHSYEYADQALELLEKLNLQGSVPYATTLLNTANAYRAGGRLEDSLQKYEQVSGIYQENLPADDMLWANFFNNLSLLYQEMGRFDLARESLLKALSIVVTKPDTIFEQAVTYTNLATTCLQLNQGEDARQYFTGAILLFEKYGIRDSHYCAALASMGTYLYQKGEYAEAQKYFEKAMRGIEASLGKNEYYRRMQENADLCREAQMQVHLPKKGLDLSREFYEAYGRPMIDKEFAAYRDRIAVGLVGEGSDCFGFDDGFSEDHDWGPRFMMWVSRETYEEIGKELEEAYQKLPKEFQGYVYKESRQGTGRRGVFITEEFYAGLLGVELPGEGNFDTAAWENMEPERLAAATNGQVFTDPEGSFTDIRCRLKEEHPQWLKYTRIAEAAARFSQAGQYNYTRMKKRGEDVAASMMLWSAVKEALLLLYYAADVYPPHDKWLMRGLEPIEEYAGILALLEEVEHCRKEEAASLLEKIAEELALLLYRADIISDVEPYLEEHVAELLFKADASKKTEQELAEQITKTEFEAFDKVKNLGGRADCQDDWFTFSIMRKSQYFTWNKKMLLQYDYDFCREMAKGHNLIEEKYGRMMESTAFEEFVEISAGFPAIDDKKRSIIENIVSMQVAWMEAFATDFPHLAGNARSIHTYEDNLYNTSYETYLRGEISTYSDKMLELYGRYIVEYAKNGGNPARDIMEHSVLMYGYEDLEDAEKRLAH